MKKAAFTELVLGILFSSLVLSCTDRNPDTETAAPLPNIVLIFTDDQGYADVGVFGAKGYETPHLDQLAREGVQLTNFHVANAVCSASRASLLTGCYSNRLGIFGALSHESEHGLNPAEETIAEVLKPLGYATGIVGKWHLGHKSPFLPTKQGFDEFYGLPYSNDMWPYHPERPNFYPPLPLYENEVVIDTLEDQRMLTTWYTERAVDFIKREKDGPFFLYLAHSMPHVPLFVSDKFRGKSENGLYGDVIMEIDWSVGRVMEALEQPGLAENTLVIFASDNGPWLSYGSHAGSTGKLKEGKGTSWEGGVRVPGIMKWPGKIPAGTVMDQPVMTIDLLPTLAHLTGADLPVKKIDGKNIWPLLAQEAGARSPHDAYYIYYNRNELQALLMNNWKLVLPHRYRSLPKNSELPNDGTPIRYEMVALEEPALFDLSKDPGESLNLADQHPEVVEEMIKLAERAREDMGDALQDREGANNRLPGRLGVTNE
ncbi:sulfatase [Cyclobacterium xiamenense]|uniref:sulfatase family protein n=1 Tax=Cyclobacterium xiamenense TaxID=1297121 RepID=UPI0035CF1162